MTEERKERIAFDLFTSIKGTRLLQEDEAFALYQKCYEAVLNASVNAQKK